MIIRDVIFDGLDCLEMINEGNRIVVTKSIGPRICYFGKENGFNILYWNTDSYQRKEWKLNGGHRVWLTRPLADESEDTYLEDNKECHIEYYNDGISISSPANTLGIIRGMKIRELNDGDFSVTNFIKNDGDLLYSAGVWSPTCINPDGDKRFAISIGADDSATWDLIKLVIPRKFGANKIRINDDQIAFNEGFMMITPKGKVCKRCVYSAKGYIIMTSKKDNLTFVKKVESVRDGNYQMDGCNMAIFVGEDNFMVEMETYGEEKTMYPGEVLDHKETWKLLNYSVDFDNWKDIDSIVG